jgi:hypothetical protein
VLFADPTVQKFVHQHFVAAWESVRAVPMVTIDFGDGHVLQRTLNGNVATYVCTPDGRVIDVIPGLCDPSTYVASLTSALDLYARTGGDAQQMAAWHRDQIDAADRAVTNIVVPPGHSGMRLDVSKTVIEDPLKEAMLRDQELVAEDGRRNLAWRRPHVQRLLARPGLRPRDITHELYREVLHVDLDDPYLGLDGGPFSGGAYGDLALDKLREVPAGPR